MTHQFKPGDLALIVGANTDTENIGKVCELLELIQPGKAGAVIVGNGRPARHDEAMPCWLVTGETLTQPDPKFNGYAIRWSRYLMPLRGYFAPEHQKSREVSA